MESSLASVGQAKPSSPASLPASFGSFVFVQMTDDATSEDALALSDEALASEPFEPELAGALAPHPARANAIAIAAAIATTFFIYVSFPNASRRFSRPFCRLFYALARMLVLTLPPRLPPPSLLALRCAGGSTPPIRPSPKSHSSFQREKRLPSFTQAITMLSTMGAQAANACGSFANSAAKASTSTQRTSPTSIGSGETTPSQLPTST